MANPGKATATVSVRISNDLYREVAALARKRDCTLGEALELLILEREEAALEKHRSIEKKLEELLKKVKRLEEKI